MDIEELKHESYIGMTVFEGKGNGLLKGNNE